MLKFSHAAAMALALAALAMFGPLSAHAAELQKRHLKVVGMGKHQ